MKLSTTSFFSVIAALFAIAAVSSCAKTDRFAGTWQGNPENIVKYLPEAATASSVMTLDFAPDASNPKTGTVAMMAVIEISQAVGQTSPGIDMAYQTNITGTAMINAKYAFDDDDDIILSLDASTMKVNIDPAGVSFTQNLVSDTERPVLDSLTAATADHWRIAITGAMREVFNKYRKIDDIKVHHGDLMSCEIDDRDLSFRRVGVPD